MILINGQRYVYQMIQMRVDRPLDVRSFIPNGQVDCLPAPGVEPEHLKESRRVRVSLDPSLQKIAGSGLTGDPKGLSNRPNRRGKVAGVAASRLGDPAPNRRACKRLSVVIEQIAEEKPSHRADV